MTKQHVNPASVFQSLDHGFSQAVAASGKRTLYVSGQTAWDAQRNLVGEGDLGAQAHQAFRNLGTVLEAAGGAPSDVVSQRIYIVNYKPEDAEAVGSAYRGFFASAGALAVADSPVFDGRWRFI